MRQKSIFQKQLINLNVINVHFCFSAEVVVLQEIIGEVEIQAQLMNIDVKLLRV